MKLISFKTLMASLLGVLFIIIKIRSYDGITDLLWIVFFGYLIVKGLHISFSKEAYDEDVKEAYQGKALCSDLFGRFAFIATDIPVMVIILAGLIAAFCPITTLLRVVLLVLLGFAVVYALWISWYISKHKQIRKDNGKWGTAVLSAEEEHAWKCSERWHNVFMIIIVMFCVPYLFFGDPRIHINNNKLEEVITKIDSNTVMLEEIVPFEWTTVYTFDPYTSLDRIEWVTGSNSPALKESVSEGMTHLVFMNKGRVMASVCAYPDSVGYSLSFAGGSNTYYPYPDGGYSHIEYGDQVEFDVTREDDIVRLYAYIE